MTITIEKNREHAEERLAQICAELARQGVTFAVDDNHDHYTLTFKGGY